MLFNTHNKSRRFFILIEKVRACIKCKEYIPIYPNNSINQKNLKEFDVHHHQHTVIIISHDEVKDLYKRVNNNE